MLEEFREKKSLKALSGYGDAAAQSILALAGSWVFYPAFGNSIVTVFYVVILVSAWQGGLEPAVLSMIISIVAIIPLLVAPLGAPGFSAEDGLHVTAFLAGSVIIVLITASRAKENRTIGESLEAERHNEARIVAMMDSVAEALVLVSPDQRVLSANQRFEELFGVPSEQVVGRRFDELQPILGQIFADPTRLAELVASSATDAAQYLTKIMVQNWPQPPITEKIRLHRHDPRRRCR
jgi:PAS domain-containing protein